MFGLCSVALRTPNNVWLTRSFVFNASRNPIFKNFIQRQPKLSVRYAGDRRPVANPGPSGSARRPKIDFELNIDLTKHTKIYTNPKSGFYKFIIFIGLVQGFLWEYLGYFTFFFMHDEPSLDAQTGVKGTWLYKNKYRVIITTVFETLGIIALVACLYYPSRNIKQLWLLKGGHTVRIITFSPFQIRNFNRRVIDTPINHISALKARHETKSSIPIKVKEIRYYYLLDGRDGIFHHPKVYDYTIGLKRMFK